MDEHPSKVHDHEAHSELSEMELRVRALQSVLAQKGYIDTAALDVLIDTYQTKIGPRNGARVVARAWVDPNFRSWLQRDATAAIASLVSGMTSTSGNIVSWESLKSPYASVFSMVRGGAS